MMLPEPSGFFEGRTRDMVDMGCVAFWIGWAALGGLVLFTCNRTVTFLLENQLTDLW